jgi:hypothetical protein
MGKNQKSFSIKSYETDTDLNDIIPERSKGSRAQRRIEHSA